MLHYALILCLVGNIRLQAATEYHQVPQDCPEEMAMPCPPPQQAMMNPSATAPTSEEKLSPQDIVDLANILVDRLKALACSNKIVFSSQPALSKSCGGEKERELPPLESFWATRKNIHKLCAQTEDVILVWVPQEQRSLNQAFLSTCLATQNHRFSKVRVHKYRSTYTLGTNVTELHVEIGWQAIRENFQPELAGSRLIEDLDQVLKELLFLHFELAIVKAAFDRGSELLGQTPRCSTTARRLLCAGSSRENSCYCRPECYALYPLHLLTCCCVEACDE
ncbi:hypothetical protein EBZ39_06140 [bacterium]|nr:hypothetical protein [bacterium]